MLHVSCWWTQNDPHLLSSGRKKALGRCVISGPRADLRKVLSERAVEASAAAWKNVPPCALRQATRCTAPVARARQIAMYFAHIVFAANLTRAGGIFGRDRTTARHACSQMEDLRDDPRVDRAFDAMELALKSWVGAFSDEASI